MTDLFDGVAMDSFDFPLPEVEGAKATAPRLHVSESKCVACE